MNLGVWKESAGDARVVGVENGDEFGSTHGSHRKQTVDKQIDISFSNTQNYKYGLFRICKKTKNIIFEVIHIHYSIYFNL